MGRPKQRMGFVELQAAVLLNDISTLVRHHRRTGSERHAASKPLQAQSLPCSAGAINVRVESTAHTAFTWHDAERDCTGVGVRSKTPRQRGVAERVGI